MRGLQGQIKALEAKIGAFEVPKVVSGDGSAGKGKWREEIDDMTGEERKKTSGEKPSLGEYHAGANRIEQFMKDASRW